MFSACVRLSTSTSKLPFLVFLTVFGLALVDITFSMRKGENLARQTSSKDSITMNLGKSPASFSKSDSERFRLEFLFEDAIHAVYFHWPYAPPPTKESNLCWEWTKGVPIRLGSDGGYATSILELRVGFRAVANFKFSALVKFLFSIQLTLSHRLLATNR